MKYHIVTKGSVFDSLGFDEVEANNLKIRAELMSAIERELDKRKLAQAKAAKILGVSQHRLSDIRRGKIQLFTIDALVNILVKLGMSVSLIVVNRLAT